MHNKMERVRNEEARSKEVLQGKKVVTEAKREKGHQKVDKRADRKFKPSDSGTDHQDLKKCFICDFFGCGGSSHD